MSLLLLLATLFPQDATIRIVRNTSCPQSIMGILYVNNKKIGHTLERPGHTKPDHISAGTYSAFIRTDPGSRNKPRWRVELEETGRDNIQIHIGNTSDQTLGCILLGTGLGSNGCTVSGSADAMRSLEKELAKYGVSNQALRIEVIIED